MRYYKVLQLKHEQPEQLGRYQMTMTYDKHTIPVGYCKDGYTHTSEAEALECYRQYLLDKRLNLNWEVGDYHPCAICGTLTNKQAHVDNYYHYFLCDEHRHQEQVKNLFILKPGWEAWES